MTLHSPIYLALLVLIPLIWWRWYARGRHAAIRFSSVAALRRQGDSLRVRARVLIPLLRSLVVLLLVVGLARPRKGNEETRIFSEGIAIQAVVDVSGSMESLDFNLDGQRASRLDVVKKVFREFVAGGEDGRPAGRPDDLIGLITFAGFADSKVPLTLDHPMVLESLKEAQTAGGIETQRRIAKLREDYARAQGDANRQREIEAEFNLVQEEGGTAIGDGLGLAVKELSELDRRQAAGKPAAVKSRVVILITDGQNNAGILDPDQAGKLAASYGIKVYTIGVGVRGTAPLPQLDAFGRVQLIPTRVDIDEDTMKSIASATGGKYFRATDTDSLRKIYEEIDQLEKTKTEEKRYMQYKERATEPVRLGGWPLPSLLMAAGGLLAIEMMLVNTWLRKIP